MTVADTSRIERSIDISAPPERVWEALTDAAQLSAWFLVRIEGEIAPGAELWMTSVHPEHRNQRFLVRIAEMHRPHRLVWRWHPGEVDSQIDYAREPLTTVTFSLDASGDGTRLTVIETGFDEIALARRAKVYQDNSQGWAEVLVWLQRHAEGTR
jgi:uncharacterized protein YndB with AHSA1/START domain